MRIQFWHLGLLCLGSNGHLSFMQESHIPHQNPSPTSRERWPLNCFDTMSSCLGCALAKPVVLHIVDFLRSGSQRIRASWPFLAMCSWLCVGRKLRSHTTNFFIPSYFVSVDFLSRSKKLDCTFLKEAKCERNQKGLMELCWQMSNYKKRNQKVGIQSNRLPARRHCTTACAVAGTPWGPQKTACWAWTLLFLFSI